MAKKKTTKKAVKSVRKAKPARKKKAGGKAPTEAEMMAQWEAVMTPSAGHKRLEPMAGTWRAKTTFTMAPGAPAQVNEGISEHRFVLGGRYLHQSYKGMSMGMPFEGIGYTGYDNATKRYVGAWMDTFGTGLMTSVGTGRPSDAKIAFVSEGFEPSGKKILFDAIIKVKDKDHHSFEMWTKGPNGKRFRTMIVEYERA